LKLVLETVFATLEFPIGGSEGIDQSMRKWSCRPDDKKGGPPNLTGLRTEMSHCACSSYPAAGAFEAVNRGPCNVTATYGRSGAPIVRFEATRSNERGGEPVATLCGRSDAASIGRGFWSRLTLSQMRRVYLAGTGLSRFAEHCAEKSLALAGERGLRFPLPCPSPGVSPQ